MPHVSCVISPWGPLLNVVVGVSKPRADALRAAGQPIPHGVTAKLLVDTGATKTSIDSAVLAKLSLTPTGSANILTPSTGTAGHQVNTYDVGMAIFGATMSVLVSAIPAMAVLDGNYQGQGIEGLLGRDVLASARMTYSGPDNFVYLSF